jgi:plastocyanin
MRSRRVGLTVLLAVLVTVGLVGVACGGSSSSNTPTPQKTAQPAATKASGTTAAAGSPTAAGTAAAQGTSVTIKDFQFTPSTVTIKVGGTVTWTNDGPSTHDVTADDNSFKSGSLAQGKTYTRTFDTAGTFSYHCGIHPNMKAQVVVQSSGSSSASPGY